ncbi:hypothetical protein LTS18_009490, partial [Coniosporium uncinatum]
MDGSGPPPPPPPPHGQNPRSGSGLPPGNYDIFVIPPHSAGSGFLYLPSLQPHRNSFLAGVACTVVAVAIWSLIAPHLKLWLSTIVASGGMGVIVLILCVGIAGWAWGKTQMENMARAAAGGGSGTAGGASSSSTGAGAGPTPNGHTGGQNPQPQGAQGAGAGPSHSGPPPQSHQHHYEPPPPPAEEPPKSSWSSRNPSASAGWEKAREETRKKEEQRKREEEAKKRMEEAAKRKEEADRAARAAAEKDKWEKMRAREKEAREREAREKIAKERMDKAKDEREAKEKEAKERLEKEIRAKLEKEKAEQSAAQQALKAKTASEFGRIAPVYGVGEKTSLYPGGKPPTAPQSEPDSPGKANRYEHPSARSYVGTDTGDSFRPYDKPKAPRAKSSYSSIYDDDLSSISDARSQSTARTTPPPSMRGPYKTKDPDKIVIRGVYLFNDLFPGKAVAQLVAGEARVTDGLVLRITTEGLFVDDDVRGVGQREWDVKAWSLKLMETGHKPPYHLLRASIRDADGKKYLFVIADDEGWKVAVGL